MFGIPKSAFSILIMLYFFILGDFKQSVLSFFTKKLATNALIKGISAFVAIY